MKDYIELKDELSKTKETLVKSRNTNAKLRIENDCLKTEVRRLAEAKLVMMKQNDLKPFGELKMPLPSIPSIVITVLGILAVCAFLGVLFSTFLVKGNTPILG
jgi:hypothetical protein